MHAPRRTDEGLPELRVAILDAARDLLVERGAADLSLRRVARAVERSATSIYLHFENKDALVHALIDEGFGRLAGELEAALAAEDDAADGLRALCRAYLEFGRANPEFYEVMFSLRGEAVQTYPAESYRRARRGLALLAGVLSRLAAEGRAAPGDPDLLAATTWAALHGAVSLLISRRLDARLEPDRFLDAAVAQALRACGVGASPPSGPDPTDRSPS